MKTQNMVQVDTETYKVRFPKDVMKAVRVQAHKEQRTIINMISVLVSRGLKIRKITL